MGHLLVSLAIEDVLEHCGALGAIEGGVFVMHVCNVTFKAGTRGKRPGANFAPVRLESGMDGHAVRVEVRFLPEAMLAVGAPEGAEVLVRRQVALQVAALMRAVGTEVAAVLQPALAHTAADSRGPCYAAAMATKKKWARAARRKGY